MIPSGGKDHKLCLGMAKKGLLEGILFPQIVPSTISNLSNFGGAEMFKASKNSWPAIECKKVQTLKQDLDLGLFSKLASNSFSFDIPLLALLLYSF